MPFLQNFSWSTIFTPAFFLNLLKIVAIAVGGFLAIRLAAFVVKKTLARSSSGQTQMIVNKAIVYIGTAILVIILLSELQIDPTPLLGAAGVIGLAVGIASQTSLGNMISGIFLISEKAFEIGDIIKIGDKTGVVQSVDLLSVKLRTFDNLLIRIPNEKIISNEVTNMTRFPIRRIDLNFAVGLREDLERVKTVLLSIAEENKLCLREPEPLVMYRDFEESGVTVLFAAWLKKDDYIAVKNSLMIEIRKRLEKEGIELPYPHRHVMMEKKS